MAAAASALTIDLAVGAASPSGYDSNSIVGLGIGTQLNNEFHLGLNLKSNKLVNTVTGIDVTARSASLDLTYELNGSTGGLRPFIGAGVGNVWFSGASFDTKNALTTSLFAGFAFRVSDTVDIVLTERNTETYKVNEAGVTDAKSINSWDTTAAVRFKF
jgi:outer membrane protein W